MRRELLAVLLACVALRALVLCTFPLNVSGDGATYAHMMRARVSNLAHAGGYPWLLGLPAALFVQTYEAEAAVDDRPRPVTDESRLRSLYVQTMNHLVDLVAVVILYALVASLSTPAFGAIAAALYGLNPWHVQWATLVRPEPMQSMLLLATVALACAAYRKRPHLYVTAAITFALAVLVKPNAVLLAPLFVVVFLIDVRDRPRRLVPWTLAQASAAFLVTFAVFVLVYHGPSTGTWRLGYFTGYNLLLRLERDPGGPLFSPDNGPASGHVELLRRALPAPPTIDARELFRHVHAVAPEIRRYYREAPWPPDPTMALKSPKALHYWLGLDAGDALLRAAFWEAVRVWPWRYLSGSVQLFLETFTERERVLVPVSPAFPGADDRIAVLGTDAPPSRMLSYSPRAVWAPGAEFFQGLMLAQWLAPPLALWAVALIGAVLAWTLGDRRPGLTLAGLVLFFALWSLVFDVRNKDLRAVAPVLDGLAVLGVYHLGVWRRA